MFTRRRFAKGALVPFAVLLVLVQSCGSGDDGTTAEATDGGSTDSGTPDSGSPDSDTPDNGAPDTSTPEGGTTEGGVTDSGEAGTDAAVACVTDVPVPWSGGAAYYAAWTNGPPSDPSFFPLAVWLQNPSRADDYAAIGINLYIGLWKGPTEDQLTQLTDADMPAFADQNDTGLSSPLAGILRAWTQQDEPDNAQPNGSGGYDPCIEPSVIQSRYDDMVAADPTRPVYLNVGRGVAHEDWVGRGTCTGHLEHYPQYALGADIMSFDIYPMNSSPPVHGNLWYLAQGIDRLQEAVNHQKPIWNWIETGKFGSGGAAPTPEQVRSEVWISIVHGSMGIGYFVHQFEPSFVEAALLANDTMKTAVAEINGRITELAPVLNTQSVSGAVTVTPDDDAIPIDTMVKRLGDATYLFAVSMRAGTTSASFDVTCLPGSATATVLDESRSIPVSNGRFSDQFTDYQAHLYRIE